MYFQLFTENLQIQNFFCLGMPIFGRNFSLSQLFYQFEPCFQKPNSHQHHGL